MHLFRWTRAKGRGTSTDTLGDPLFQWFSTLIALGVVGVLIIIAIALFFGVPISLGISIFLSELAPPWIRIPLTYVVEPLAAVPSVVYGLWGIFVLAPVMRTAIEPFIQG